MKYNSLSDPELTFWELAFCARINAHGTVPPAAAATADASDVADLAVQARRDAQQAWREGSAK